MKYLVIKMLFRLSFWALLSYGLGTNKILGSPVLSLSYCNHNNCCTLYSEIIKVCKHSTTALYSVLLESAWLTVQHADHPLAPNDCTVLLLALSPCNSRGGYYSLVILWFSLKTLSAVSQLFYFQWCFLVNSNLSAGVVYTEILIIAAGSQASGAWNVRWITPAQYLLFRLPLNPYEMPCVPYSPSVPKSIPAVPSMTTDGSRKRSLPAQTRGFHLRHCPSPIMYASNFKIQPRVQEAQLD